MIRKQVKILIIAVVLIISGLLYPLPEHIISNPYSTVLEDANGELLGARIAKDGQWRFPDLDLIRHIMS